MRIPLILLLVAHLASPLAAFEFRVLSWDGPITGLFLQNGLNTEEIDGAERFFSKPHTISGQPAELELFRRVQRDDKVINQTVATISIPTDLTRAILMLVPTDAVQSRFRGFWIPDDLTRRPTNHLLIYNLSDKTVAVKSGETDVLLAPQVSRQIPFVSGARSMKLKIAARIGDEWRLVSSSRQPTHDGSRTLLIVRGGRLHGDVDATLQAAPLELVAIYDRPPLPLQNH